MFCAESKEERETYICCELRKEESVAGLSDAEEESYDDCRSSVLPKATMSNKSLCTDPMMHGDRRDGGDGGGELMDQ